MNVLLVIEGTYPWYRGGVSEWVYQYLKNCPEISFSILQIATDEFQGLDPSEALYPLTQNINKFTRISPPEVSENGQFDLEQWLQENYIKLDRFITDQDIIHVTNTGFAGWLGARLSTENNSPLLLTEHAIYWKEIDMGAIALECGYKVPTSAEAKSKTINAFKEFASYTYNHAHQVITVSNSNKYYQQKLGAEAIKYIPNGVPGSWLISEKKRGKQPVIGWVGRCAEMKNPIAFFEYVDSFRDETIDPVFVMLLSDANEVSLEKEVKELSQNYPEVTLIWNEDARSYFSRFDFLVITSHNESQPLVMLEALAQKALPAGYSVGDLTQEFGLVFDSASIPEQVRSVIELWDQPELFEKVVEKRFQKVKKEHTWEQVFEEYKRLIYAMTEPEII